VFPHSYRLWKQVENQKTMWLAAMWKLYDLHPCTMLDSNKALQFELELQIFPEVVPVFRTDLQLR
jgi:hypothetical protein